MNGRLAGTRAFMGKLAVISEETVRRSDICALGLVTLGQSPGRISDTQITVFDSSGIAIQDLMVAGAIFEAAQEMSQIEYIDF